MAAAFLILGTLASCNGGAALLLRSHPPRDAQLDARACLGESSRLLSLRGGGPLDALERLRERVLRPLFAEVSSRFQRLQPATRTAVVFALGVAAGALIAASADSFEIFQTVDDVPGAYFRRQRAIPCVVVTVADGDTMRVLHTPPLSAPRRALSQRLRLSAGLKPLKLSETTMQVRLAAVDAPEVAKFGQAAQPFADEAKRYAKTRLLGRRVYVKLLSRDQYGRAVGSVKYRQGLSPVPRDLSEDLLADGLAVVYRQGGAQYDSAEGVDKWNRIEARAKARRRGLWAGAADGAAHELPSEYKRRMRASGPKRVPAGAASR